MKRNTVNKKECALDYPRLAYNIQLTRLNLEKIITHRMIYALHQLQDLSFSGQRWDGSGGGDCAT
jgi:hypothetical protein